MDRRTEGTLWRHSQCCNAQRGDTSFKHLSFAMSLEKMTNAEIQRIIGNLYVEAKLLVAKGKMERASEMIETAACLENAMARYLSDQEPFNALGHYYFC
jgi:hypothetical protein